MNCQSHYSPQKGDLECIFPGDGFLHNSDLNPFFPALFFPAFLLPSLIIVHIEMNCYIVDNFIHWTSKWFPVFRGCVWVPYGVPTGSQKTCLPAPERLSQPRGPGFLWDTGHPRQRRRRSESFQAFHSTTLWLSTRGSLFSLSVSLKGRLSEKQNLYACLRVTLCLVWFSCWTNQNTRAL